MISEDRHYVNIVCLDSNHKTINECGLYTVYNEQNAVFHSKATVLLIVTLTVH